MAEQHTIIANAAAWREWLDAQEYESDGVWLLLAKKGTLTPTSLSYTEALDEALCSGWIDGQKRGHDEATFVQRFTPRRKASMWSQRNIGLVETLIEQGRMRTRGHAEIERAKSDGRWDRAYPGQAAAEVPGDLAAALAESAEAAAAFARLSASDRYSILHRVLTATPSARPGRIRTLVERFGIG
ncbi:MAG: YdeI/OmpD-associated family protein [Lacisediminihabitans sp.]